MITLKTQLESATECNELLPKIDTVPRVTHGNTLNAILSISLFSLSLEFFEISIFVDCLSL